MNFLIAIRRSIYDPVFYTSLLKRPQGPSWGYFFALGAVLAAVATMWLSFAVVPQATGFVNKLKDNVVAYYPDELVVTITEGVASANVPQPYYLPLPEPLRNGMAESEKPSDIEHLLTIATEGSMDIDTFKSYKTVVLLARDSVWYREEKGKISVQPLAGANFEIKKEKFAEFGRVIEMLGRFVGPLIVLGIFVALFFANTVPTLFFLLFGALFIFVLMRVREIPGSYGKAYQLGLHAATPMLLLGLFDHLIPGSQSITYLPSILFVLTAIANIVGPTRIALAPSEPPSTAA